MEKGLEGLSGAYEEEHRRQLALMEEKISKRSAKVAETLEQKRKADEERANAAALAKKRDDEIVRELRQKRANLLNTIVQGQKLQMKGCYSRPVQTFNRHLHEEAMRNEQQIAVILRQQ